MSRIARLATLVIRLTLACLAAAGPAAAAQPYQLGQGYPLPWHGLTAGGYASLRLTALEGARTRFEVQDLSLFLHGDLSPTWRFFSEIELGEPLIVPGHRVTSQTDLDVERLYLDHTLSPRTTLRLGKFLTPVGRWNVIHAEPLTWSASRPLTTSAAFARHASGLDLYGTQPLGRSSVDYHLYADATAALDPTQGLEDTYEEPLRPNPPSAFRHAAGLYLRWRNQDDNLQVGFSAARYSMKQQPASKLLAGVDFFYARSGYELAGEYVYRRDEHGGGRDERGGYLQLAAPITDGLHTVLTHERYRLTLFPRALEWTGIGLAWRPLPPLSLKLEYRESRGEERLMPDGWLLTLGSLL